MTCLRLGVHTIWLYNMHKRARYHLGKKLKTTGEKSSNSKFHGRLKIFLEGFEKYSLSTLISLRNIWFQQNELVFNYVFKPPSKVAREIEIK